MKRRLVLVLAYLFFASLLPWRLEGACFQYYDQCAQDVIGSGTGSITGFNIPLYITEHLSVYDALTAWVDVRAYGAVGDGVTDDTEALAEAVTEALASGVPLFVPAGTFTTTDELLFAMGSGSKPLTIFGVGGKSILKSTGTTNKIIHITATQGAMSGPVVIKDINLQGGTSGTGAALLHIDGVAIFSLRDLRLEGNSKTTYGALLTATQQGEISGGYNASSSTGLRLENAGAIASNSVDIHGVSFSNNVTNVDYAGVATGFLHDCQMETATNSIVVSAVIPQSARITIRSNHIEGFDNGIVNHVEQAVNISHNTFLGKTGCVDIDLDYARGSVIDGNTINGNVILRSNGSQYTFSNNLSVGASTDPSIATITDNSTSITYFGNKNAGYGFELYGSKFRGQFDFTQIDGTSNFRIPNSGNFQIFKPGIGIQMTNAADNVTKIIRLNDAGDGFIFENP